MVINEGDIILNVCLFPYHELIIVDNIIDVDIDSDKCLVRRSRNDVAYSWNITENISLYNDYFYIKYFNSVEETLMKWIENLMQK